MVLSVEDPILQLHPSITYYSSQLRNRPSFSKTIFHVFQVGYIFLSLGLNTFVDVFIQNIPHLSQMNNLRTASIF